MDFEATDIAVLSTAVDGLVQPMVVGDSCSTTTTTTATTATTATTTSKFAHDVVKENSDDTTYASSSTPLSLSLPLVNADQYQLEDSSMVTAESDHHHHHPGSPHPSIYSWGRSDLHCLFHHADAQHKDGIYSSSCSSDSGSSHHEGSSKNFIFIASNLYHSAALTSTGELYTTGDNSEGQVRDNSCSATTDESEDNCLMTSSSTISKRKPQIVESLATQRISSVACGSSHTVCVTASGCAISFGGNECGQLGHSVDKISHVAPRMTTFAVHRSVHGHAVGVVVKKVACGDLFTLFLSTTGEVYGCGSSIYLGNNIATTAIRPSATAKLTATTNDRKTSDDVVLQATNVCPAQRIDALVGLHIVDITAGSTHSMAITATGELYTWGANNQFQLGYDCSSISSSSMHQQLPRKVLFEAQYGPLQVVGIKAGYQHSIVWTHQGLLLGSGANKYGQLGLPSPRVESFTVIPLDYSCTMAACGYNHTLALCDSSKRISSSSSSSSSSCSGDLVGSMTEIGAASTVLYGFGANNNNQVSGSTTLSMIRSPMALNDNLKVWSISKIHYIAAGGDQSFVIADTSDGPAAIVQLDTSFSQQQQYDDHHQHRFPLRKQFSTLVSKSVEPMSSASMCSLLLKAKKEKVKEESRNDVAISMQSDGNSPDESLMTNQPHHEKTTAEYTYALSAVLEIFASPSLLGGSFLRSIPSSSSIPSSIPSSSLPLSPWSSFEQSLDVQGLENCYVTLMQLGSEVSARLLAATQQAITEIEHAVQKASLGSCSISSSMQASLVKVVMILWQNPLMANPKLSLDLFSRLMIIASGTCQKKYELMGDVFRCYPQHILVTRVLKPLQEHLSFHLQAWQSDPTGALVMTSKRKRNNNDSNNREGEEDDDILTLLCSFLKSLYDHHSHSNNKESYLAPDLFYNPQIDRFNDLMLMKDCLDWQKKQGKNTFTIHNTTSTIPTDPDSHRFYFSQYPFLLSIDVKLRMLNAESQMHQQFAQQRAVNFGLFSGTNIIQPWFVLQVQREHLLQQTLIHISSASTIDLKKPLKVVFIGEEGVDAGGVKKELFQLLISQLFSDQYGMFHTAASGRVLWITHTNRWCSDEYKLVGTLLALAVYNGVLLDVQLPPVFYRKLLQQQPTVQSSLMEDLKGIDPELHTGLLQLLHFEPAMEVEYVFCKNFVVEWDEYGAPMSKELIEDGKSVAVTADNRQLYVDKLLDWTLNESISEQFSSLLEGFHRIINPSMIEHFTALELERLMTGLPHLDFKELEESTEYVGDSTWTTENPVITAFWSTIHTLPFEDKQKFLLFVTGSNKAPVGGLKKLNLRIQRMGPHSDSLPTAHTCFNTLLLPEYSSSDVLKDRLLKAIHECEGFGLK